MIELALSAVGKFQDYCEYIFSFDDAGTGTRSGRYFSNGFRGSLSLQNAADGAAVKEGELVRDGEVRTLARLLGMSPKWVSPDGMHMIALWEDDA